MPRLRISGGELRGRRIEGPPAGAEVRPTTERVREAVFSMLGDVSGARVLDLYCGSGALALEAISRGAGSAVLVDLKPALARRNIRALGLEQRAEAVGADARAYLEGASGGFDLVLCDPPYGLVRSLQGELDQPLRRALAPEGRVIVETATEAPLELDLPLARERRYGDTLVRIHVAEESR